ncbi:hypothetical protein [Psychrobacter sp. FDAARGOS_221]|uniref:hypothetical protein n=1 Tax=Psychrobacter sp. FDAARGOS_221 TaxID=1975705 RepID=UPI000BB577BE|nr:hypothetical protein [Psychrobacter sp. FDAARGOS_221]PNK60842.1 hypothetical protein A6J60_008095 [Psychrobacter sp. FDAARGOS_221]
MPLEAVAINRFDAPLMRETTHEDELRDRIAKLYDSPDANKGDLADAEAVMALFEAAFKRGNLMYVGMFNDKPIAAVGCFDDGQTDAKRLQYLAIHPENVNRGIDAKFIKLVYDQEVRKGVRQFVPVDDNIHQIMTEYELLRVKS